jgi:hypothetical protein
MATTSYDKGLVEGQKKGLKKGRKEGVTLGQRATVFWCLKSDLGPFPQPLENGSKHGLPTTWTI